MDYNSRIFVAGHAGLLGSAMVRALHENGFNNVHTRTHAQLDLLNVGDVGAFFSVVQPEYVFMMAGHVGGILANKSFPVQFLVQNARMALNVIEWANWWDVKKLIYTSSSCAYPKLAENPIQEHSLLTGAMEPTNRPYALAKILGMELCESYRRQWDKDFVSVMPTNLYGPNDHYNPLGSHVLPGMMDKLHYAKVSNSPQVTLWGSGNPIREFLHSEDCALAHLHIMQEEESFQVTNIGGEKIRLRDLAEKIAKVVNYKGEILWDTTKPDGTPDRQLDSSRVLNTGYMPRHTLDETLPEIYSDFLTQLNRT